MRVAMRRTVFEFQPVDTDEVEEKKAADAVFHFLVEECKYLQPGSGASFEMKELLKGWERAKIRAVTR